MPRHVTVRELRPRLARILEDVNKRFERYIVTKRGRPIAMILSPDDFEGLIETLDILGDKATMKRLRKAQRDVRAGKTRSLEEIEASMKRV